MAALPLTREQHEKKRQAIIADLKEFQTLTGGQRYEGLTKQQEDIIRDLNDFLNNKENKKVLDRYWELTKLASKLLNHKSEHVKVFTATDCWGTCTTSSGSKTELASRCAADGGSFTPFPSGC